MHKLFQGRHHGHSNVNKPLPEPLVDPDEGKTPIGELAIVPIQGRDVPNRERFGKQNPFILFKLGNVSKRSSTDVRGGQRPRWKDDQITILMYESDAKDAKSLYVSCLDEDKQKNDLIGDCVINLAKVLEQGEQDDWFELTYKGREAGELMLQITYFSHNPSHWTHKNNRPSMKTSEATLGAPLRRPIHPLNPHRISTPPPVASSTSSPSTAPHPNAAPVPGHNPSYPNGRVSPSGQSPYGSYGADGTVSNTGGFAAGYSPQLQGSLHQDPDPHKHLSLQHPQQQHLQGGGYPQAGYPNRQSYPPNTPQPPFPPQIVGGAGGGYPSAYNTFNGYSPMNYPINGGYPPMGTINSGYAPQPLPHGGYPPIGGGGGSNGFPPVNYPFAATNLANMYPPLGGYPTASYPGQLSQPGSGNHSRAASPSPGLVPVSTASGNTMVPKPMTGETASGLNTLEIPVPASRASMPGSYPGSFPGTNSYLSVDS
ncbi:hypothetical protein BGW38_003364, partial [Lunasporangiospora selenospora]